MRRSTVRYIQRSSFERQYVTSTARPPIISISNASFYRHHPNSHHAATTANPVLFPDLTFEIPPCDSKEHWAILGPSSSGKTTFLQILRGHHLSIPPTARSYPWLEKEDVKRRLPSQAIKHVGFDGEQGVGAQAPQSAYLSARYESRREETDFSVLDYLQGHTELNPLQDIGGDKISDDSLQRVIKDLKLGDLVNMPVQNLSNGQTRRARIAKALLLNPEILLLDEPFMGLDPPTLKSLSPMLYGLASRNSPRLVLALRPQDPIPDWITHLIYLNGNCQVAFQGPKKSVLCDLRHYVKTGEDRGGRVIQPRIHIPLHSLHEIGRELTGHGVDHSGDLLDPTTATASALPAVVADDGSATQNAWSRDGYELEDNATLETGEPLVEMEGVRVTYGNKTVLGDWTQNVENSPKEGLWWTIKRGERWGIFGPNGSGKTTILSLICSDHPQTYSLPIRLFGRSRIPEPGQTGISIFDIQSRIGHSSPELHRHIPKSLTLRKVLANAWADTFRGVPKLDESANARIDACLRWFEQDLRPQTNGLDKKLSSTTEKPEWADQLLFGGLTFSSQRVALFLRAIIKQPDLVILDEAFSGMDDGVRDRCLLFLAHGETKRISHTTAHGENGSNQTKIVESEISKTAQVKLGGLTQDQAILCISHVREEIPGSIREWICLPEANTGEPARFGRLDGPIEGNYRRWNEIWGM